MDTGCDPPPRFCMSVRSGVRTILAAIVVLVAATLLIGQLLGQPVLLSYVETGSMEPTLDAGDGFVAIPAEAAGPIEEGDVIVFEARQIHGGGLTTHRVVEVTDQGYVTRGDANPFTDQDNGEPRVTDGQIVAKAWRVDGSVVAIPNLGTALETASDGFDAARQRIALVLGIPALVRTEWLTMGLFGVGVLSMLAGSLTDEEPSRNRDRSRSRPGIYEARTIVLAVGVVVFVAAGGAMLASGGTHEYGIVSAEFDGDGETVVPVGETRIYSVPVRNGAVLPVYAVAEPASSGVDVDPRAQRLDPRGNANATIAVSAPPETGYYVRSFSEYHYFAVLPRSMVLAAHSIHPWLAVFVVSTALSGATTIALWLALGPGPIRTRDAHAGRRRNREEFTND